MDSHGAVPVRVPGLTVRVEARVVPGDRDEQDVDVQKELQEAGEGGYQVIGMTVGKTAMGGNELVTILRRLVAR